MKEGGGCVRQCRAMCGAQDEGTGNVNKMNGGWWCLTSSDLCRQERGGRGRMVRV